MPCWRGTSSTVSRGLGLIAEGALDGEGASIDSLAERLGVGERQLRRLFQQHLGASPIAVAQTRRVLFAKQLVHETRLPMAEIALAAGFGSVRRFNEAFQSLFQRSPSELRRKSAAEAPELPAATSGVTVRLRYRCPFDWDAMLSYLSARAIEGVESVVEGRYQRTVMDGEQVGTVQVGNREDAHSLEVTIRFPSVRALGAIVARVRRVFDVAADVGAIGAHLARDPWLAPLIAARPGLRAPGGWDGFELAVRAILGQQVSVEAGRQLARKLARICGTPVPANDLGLDLAFPTAGQVAVADLSGLGMPNARRRALFSAALAALAEPHLFHPRATVEETVEHLRSIPGIGDWTAQYIALRASREPDAFPSTDVGLLRGATRRGGVRPTAAQLSKRAERWRPFRAYAAQHLWVADSVTRPTPARGDS